MELRRCCQGKLMEKHLNDYTKEKWIDKMETIKNLGGNNEHAVMKLIWLRCEIESLICLPQI